MDSRTWLLSLMAGSYDGIKIAIKQADDLISYVKFAVLIFCDGFKEMARIIHLTLLRLN